MSLISRLPEIPPEIMRETPAHFRKECLQFHHGSKTTFEEGKFNGFVENILADPVLRTYFAYSHFFRIYEDLTSFELALLTLQFPRELLTPELHGIFLDGMKKLKNDYFPYTLILWDLFEATWVSYCKILKVDHRDTTEIFRESAPKRYISPHDGAICYYEVRGMHHLGPTVVTKRVYYDTDWDVKKIYEYHMFGVSRDEARWKNADLKIMRKHFREEWKVLPDRSQTEYLLYYHPEPLAPSISLEQLEKGCQKLRGVALAWGPRFINLFSKEVSYMRNKFGIEAEWKDVKDASSNPTLYPPNYWVLMEYPDEVENTVCYHFLGAINKLDQCRSDAAIPTWLKTVLERAVAKDVKRKLEKAKKREEPSFFEGLHHEIDKDGEITAEERFAGEPPLSVAPFDFDSLFPNPRENYIAKNFSRKGVVKDAAQRFGLTERRIQQIKKKVGEILDRDEDERSAQAHLCVWFPGLDDDNIVRGELRRIASLLYKKPQYQWPHKFTKGRVKRKAQDRTSQETPRLRKKS
jgi:hypothetical protein